MQIFDIFEGTAPKVVVTYPGRFQPFHKGHAEVFHTLQKQFGSDNVYIVSSDKVDPPRSPFNFSDKVQFMKAAGIPAHSIIQAAKVYDLPAQFEQEKPNIIFITALGAPEAQRLGTGGQKKDGSPAYFQPMPKDSRKLETADKHGYVIVEPEFPQTITVGGDTIDVSHGTQTRALWSKVQGNPQLRKEFITQMYGKYHSELEPILDKISAVTETIRKVGSGYRLVSHTGKNLGTYPNKAGAEKRERQVQYFKHANEGEVTRTATGLTHRATDKYGAGEEDPYNTNKNAMDLDRIDKKKIKDLDASMGITYKQNGPHGLKVDEEAAGVGVVKNGKDPRYMTATMGDDNDVTAATLPQMMKNYNLVPGKKKTLEGEMDEDLRTGLASNRFKAVMGRKLSKRDRFKSLRELDRDPTDDEELDEVSVGNYYSKAQKSKISNIAKTMFADPADPEVIAAKRALANRERGIGRVSARNRKELAAQQEKQRADSLAADTANLDQLKASLAQLRAEFDPDYEFSDDHRVWTKNRDIAQRINALQRRIFDVTAGVDEGVMESAIVQNIIRNHRAVFAEHGVDAVMQAARVVGRSGQGVDTKQLTVETICSLQNALTEGMFSYNKESPFDSEFAPDVGMGRMTLRSWKQSLARRLKEISDYTQEAVQSGNIDQASMWENIYKKMQNLNLDPIAKEIELAHAELEKVRRQGGVRSRAFKQKQLEVQTLEENWKKKLGALGLAGAIGMGAAGPAHADGIDKFFEPVQKINKVMRDVDNWKRQTDVDFGRVTDKVGRNIEDIPIPGISKIGSQMRGNVPPPLVDTSPGAEENARRNAEMNAEMDRERAERRAEHDREMRQVPRQPGLNLPW